MSDQVCGKRIKKLRQVNHLTLDRLAKEIDCTKRTIQRYENDYIIPDVYYLVRLADVFGVTTDYLLGLSDTPNETTQRPPFFVLSKAIKNSYKYLKIKNYGGQISNVLVKFYDILNVRDVRTKKYQYYMVVGRYYQANERTGIHLIDYDYETNSFNLFYNHSYYLTDKNLEENIRRYLQKDFVLSINKIIVIEYTDYKHDFYRDYFRLDQFDTKIQLFEYFEEPLLSFRYLHLDAQKFSYYEKAQEMRYLLQYLDTIIISDDTTTTAYFKISDDINS